MLSCEVPPSFEAEGRVRALDWVEPPTSYDLFGADDAHPAAELARRPGLAGGDATVAAAHKAYDKVRDADNSSFPVHNGPALVTLPDGQGYLGMAHITRREGAFFVRCAKTKKRMIM